MQYEEAKNKAELNFMKEFTNPIQRSMIAFSSGFRAGFLFKQTEESEYFLRELSVITEKYEGQIKINFELAKKIKELERKA